jgi:hypothetical protein
MPTPHASLNATPAPQRYGFGYVVPFVMIGDNQIDPAVARDFRLLDRGHATVDGDDQLRAA